MAREDMMRQSGYTSKIVDFVMHKHFDKKQNRVTHISFDITYEETRPDGSIYQYILTGVDSPFKEVCNISTEEYDPLIMFCGESPSYTPHVLSKLELWGSSVSVPNTYKIKCIKEPDPIEVTMEEIEAKFGKKVKIVREK